MSDSIQPPRRAVPPPPEKPIVNADDGKNQKGSWLSIFLVSIFTVSGLLVLSFMSFGFVALVCLVGLVVFAMIAFHYLVWGWWAAKIREEFDDE